MQFKHPEILWFLFLLVIPIIVHLFQLRRFRKEYFTNVRFLKELSIQTRKSSKLKKWLLLATRLLMLAALIIAFAQPFFKAKDKEHSSNEMFIILDNSFSMQAKGQKGELLKRAVEDLLQHTPENLNFSILTNSESFWSTDIKSSRRDLQNLKYSAAPFNLEAMMAKVKSRKSAFNKDVIVITDGVGMEARQLKSISEDVNAYFILPQAQQRFNVSVDSVYLIQTLDNFYEIGVKMSAYGGGAKEIPVGLYNDERLIAKTQIRSNAIDKPLKFTIPKEDFHGYVTINDNGLAYDNILYFSLSKPEKTNVISIGESAKSDFLQKIYTVDEFNFNNFELGGLDYNQLEKQDAIIVNELREIPQALATTLKSFVEKGGNLIIIPSAEANVAGMNSFLGTFGNIQLRGLNQSKRQVTGIAFGHPLYNGVFEKRIENFQYPEAKISFDLSSSSPSALTFEDQGSFLTTIRQQASNIYVFAAPTNRDNSNFQNSPLIVPTFYNMAQNLSKTGIIARTIGDDSPFLVDADLAKDEIINVANKEQTFIPVQQILNNKVRLSFNDYPTDAGNFEFISKGRPVGKISFNYSRTEGNVSATNDIFSEHHVVENLETVFDKMKTDRTDNEIWKIFVIVALLFLVIEILIQKFLK